MSNSKRHLVFVGQTILGKTTIGKKVAEELELKFVDLDVIIEQQTEMTVHEFFAKEGELAFRELETEVLLNALADETPSLITPGAGIVLKASNIAAMRKNATVVYLNAQVKDIIARIEGDKENVRPLVEGNVDAKVKELFDQRQ